MEIFLAVILSGKIRIEECKVKLIRPRSHFAIRACGQTYTCRRFKALGDGVKLTSYFCKKEKNAKR